MRSYAPKYDLWLVVATWGLMVVPLGIGAVAIAVGDTWQGVVVIAGGVGVIVVVMLGFAWPVRYVLDGDVLRVESGRWLRWQVDVQNIVRVGPVRTAYSSPAWSFDKLEIEYRRGTARDFLLIAPRDRETFLTELAARNSSLFMDDEGRSLQRSDLEV